MSSFDAEWEMPEFDSVPSLAQNMVYLLRDCDDTLIRKTLQEAYHDFCARSAALRTWRKVEIADGETNYLVAPILSADIDCITQVLRYGRFPLRQGRDWRTIGDSPAVIHLPFLRGRRFAADAELVEDVPPDFVMVEAVEVPRMSEERAPQAFLRRYGDAIIDGALVRLFSMANRPWSDGEQARQHGIAYSNALSEARQRGMCGGPAANADNGFALDLRGMV